MMNNPILMCEDILKEYNISYQKNNNNLVFYLFNGTVKMKLKFQCYKYYLTKYFTFNNRYVLEWSFGFRDFEFECLQVLLNELDKNKKFKLKVGK